ncbi:MAG: archaetidylserine decarboxylase [Plesiomonas shigelloides]
MFNQVKIALQYLLPKQRLTQLAGWAAEKNAGALTHWVIRLFARHYGINMQEAQKSDLSAYASFNEFFTRPLKHSARPIDFAHNCLCLPADGMISQIGPLRDDLLLQAKGHYYSPDALLAGQTEWVRRFRHGAFATTYLSPRDSHRVHMPCDGTLREMIYVPGELFSVNPLTAENVPGLFARNERVICLFDTAAGPMAQILVGATIVGSIETVWAGTITPPRRGKLQRWTYPAAGDEQAVHLTKGQEMGRFKLGSTVINLFPEGSVAFECTLQQGVTTRMGERFARLLSAPSSAEGDTTLASPHSGA